MLLESGCEVFALNLCGWCVRSSVFADDVFIHRTHLMLLCTNSDTETFHEQVGLLKEFKNLDISLASIYLER